MRISDWSSDVCLPICTRRPSSPRSIGRSRQKVVESFPWLPAQGAEQTIERRQRLEVTHQSHHLAGLGLVPAGELGALVELRRHLVKADRKSTRLNSSH